MLVGLDMLGTNLLLDVPFNSATKIDLYVMSAQYSFLKFKLRKHHVKYNKAQEVCKLK